MEAPKNKLLLMEELILLDLEAKNSEEALSKLAINAQEYGIVKDSFKQALFEREKEFPTGLQSSAIGVAIPHTDAIHVNTQAISVAVLREPVSFIHMGTEDQNVSVEIIIMLAIKHAHSQLEVLQKLIALIQKEDVLKQIKESNSSSFVLELLEKELTQEE